MSIKVLNRFLKSSFLLCLSVILLCGVPQGVQAFWFSGGEPLLQINDTAYTSSDFRTWWRKWREPDSKLPVDLTPFIDWMLLVQESRDMELDENREYRRKINIFLKSRSLMMLKQEEVDSRLKEPERKVLWLEYEKKYQPILELKILQLADQVVAENILKACIDGTDPKQAALAAGLTEPRFLSRKGVRPNSVSEEFKPLFEAEVEKGTFLLISGATGFQMVVEVVDKQAASDEDFTGKVEALRKTYFRSLERQLNIALIERLQQKYETVINDDALVGIETLVPGDAALQDTVITIGDIEVPAWQVVRLIEENRRMFKNRLGQATMTIEKIKKLVLDNILVQTLIALEARDRHYENKLPFKETYNFYCQRRLIKELEKTVLWSQVEVTRADLEGEYEKMAEQFSQADEVEVAWIRLADDRLSRLLTKELNQGRDFFKVMEPYFPQGVEFAREKEDRLRPVLREIVSGLEPGQVSAPVKNGEDTFFVKLIRRIGNQRLSLDDVSEMLQTRLREEGFAAARQKLLETLKSRSQIVVKERRWRKLRRELLKEAATSVKISRIKGDAS